MNSLQTTYFLALCKYRNFTETARRLYTSQPAVSKQIFALENELNVSLFRREYKAVYLTEEGKILQKALEHTTEIMQKAQQEMYQLKHPNEYTLKIAVLQGMEIAERLRPALMQFTKRHPNIHITAECLSHENLNTMLRMNELDFAITLEDETDNDTLLRSVQLFQTQLAFTVHRSHPLFEAEEITPASLADQCFLVTTIGTRGSSAFLDLLRDHYGITEEQLSRLSSMDEVITAMNSGRGIAVFPKQDRFSDNMTYRQFPLKNAAKTIVGAWHYANENTSRNILAQYLLSR